MSRKFCEAECRLRSCCVGGGGAEQDVLQRDGIYFQKMEGFY
jgi:hypothetical protein